MQQKLSPEDLINNDEYELLTEITHQNIREFIIDQIKNNKSVLLIYSIYQVVMITLFSFLFGKSIVLAIKDKPEFLYYTLGALLFSVTFLIIIHELLHGFAYYLAGARKISYGMILKKFIFYAQADMFVINKFQFHIVALAPFVIIKILTFTGALISSGTPLMYLFLVIMCAHSLFCAGDIAMLVFYKINNDKEIYNYDNRSEGKTYFYMRKK